MPALIHHAAPAMTAHHPPTAEAAAIPEALAMLELLNIKQVCRFTGMSASSIRARIRDGTFPPPDVVNGPRFTRWKAGTVQTWLIQITSQPVAPEVLAAQSKRATAASHAAKAKRAARTAENPPAVAAPAAPAGEPDRCTCALVVGQPLAHDCPHCLRHRAENTERAQRVKTVKKAERAAKQLRKQVKHS